VSSRSGDGRLACKLQYPSLLFYFTYSCYNPGLYVCLSDLLHVVKNELIGSRAQFTVATLTVSP